MAKWFLILFVGALGFKSWAFDEYTEKIQPIFNQRCLSCHSCFNAPCQLNLQNYEGFLRGAARLNVYDGTRLKSVLPTRLWIDAHGSEAWQKKGFFPVHNSSQENENIFLSLIRLRQNDSRQPEKKVAESHFCPSNTSELQKLIKSNPELGMPYGLPALTPQESVTLAGWINKGAPGPHPETQKAIDKISPETQKDLKQWQSLLNQKDLRHQLVARYLYEHFFLAHLYFPHRPNEFFRLVRSRQACENSIDEIATRRPNEAPGQDRFWYCFRKFTATIVEKTHLPFELSAKKLEFIERNFFAADWKVSKLPTYENDVAKNPFLAFQEIPVEARYRFLLEDSRYHIATFIKGPVCNGSNAVNSIQEQFYVFFLKPQAEAMVADSKYADQVKKLLILPGLWGSDVAPLKTPALLKSLIDHREAYRKQRSQKLINFRPKGYDLADLWDGDGKNTNAVLTVFRHFDNAVVMQGAVGDLSKTAFVLDYPLFERLVYDLVVNFDVFGNVSHQLLTRVYMDMIRMEAEEIFLRFLPPDQREKLRQSWYQGFSTKLKMQYLFPPLGRDQPTAVTYQDPKNAKTEFVQKVLFQHLKPDVLGFHDPINWKVLKMPASYQSKAKPDLIEMTLRKMASIPAVKATPFARHFPDVAYLRIRSQKNPRIFTIIHNRELENVSWILGEDLRLKPEEDSLTLREGFWAAYPNMFFDIPEESIEKFVDQAVRIQSEKDYQALVQQFGIPRTSESFWITYDALNKSYEKQSPSEFGYLDLTRYELAKTKEDAR